MNTFHAGTASCDITPPAGAVLSGGAFGPARGVLDGLCARALYLTNGRRAVMVVSCDLLGFTEAFADDLRTRIAQACRLSPTAILLAATHTHGAPCTIPLRYWGRLDDAYCADLANRLADLAAAACANTTPARLGAAVGTCAGVGVNRGVAGGAVHEDVGVIRVDDAAGVPLAVVVNHGCHPVNLHGSAMITADFPGALVRQLQARLGRDLPVLFLLGPCGDVNPTNFSHGNPGIAAAEQTAGKLARTVLELLPTIRTATTGPLEAVEAEIALPLQNLPDEAELRDILAQRGAKAAVESPEATNWAYTSHMNTIEWATEALAAKGSGRVAARRRIRLQAIRMADAVVAGIPGELFAGFGRQITDAAPGALVLIATQANGSAGYFPDAGAFARGAYEAVACPRFLGLQAYAPDVGERVAKAAADLVSRAAAGATPQ